MNDTQGDLVPRRGQLLRADKIMSADGHPYVVPNLFVWRCGQIYLHTADSGSPLAADR